MIVVLRLTRVSRVWRVEASDRMSARGDGNKPASEAGPHVNRDVPANLKTDCEMAPLLQVQARPHEADRLPYVVGGLTDHRARS